MPKRNRIQDYLIYITGSATVEKALKRHDEKMIYHEDKMLLYNPKPFNRWSVPRKGRPTYALFVGANIKIVGIDIVL